MEILGVIPGAGSLTIDMATIDPGTGNTPELETFELTGQPTSVRVRDATGVLHTPEITLFTTDGEVNYTIASGLPPGSTGFFMVGLEKAIRAGNGGWMSPFAGFGVVT